MTPGREALDGPPRRRLVILGSVTTYRARDRRRRDASAAARVSNPDQPRTTETVHRLAGNEISSPTEKKKIRSMISSPLPSLTVDAHRRSPPPLREIRPLRLRWRRRTLPPRSTRRTPPPARAASHPRQPRAPSRSSANIIGTGTPPLVPTRRTSSPAPPSRPRRPTPTSAPPHPASGRATACTSTRMAKPSSSRIDSYRPRSRSTASIWSIGSRSAR